MYLQITTRCNMKCVHCCMSCTNKGIDMPPNIVQNALRYAYDNSSHITIGGGEPTLHADFGNILLSSMCASEGPVHVITNGTITDKALVLARLIEKEVITGRLSNDPFHDMSMVDDQVYEAFNRSGNAPYIDYKEGLSDTGRARKNAEDIEWGHGIHVLPNCACESMEVTPNGNVYSCGCRKVLIGNIANYDEFSERASAFYSMGTEDIKGITPDPYQCAVFSPAGRKAAKMWKSISKKM